VAVKRRWALDETTPFEQMRVWIRPPSGKLLTEGLDNLRRAFPAFRRRGSRSAGAGLIDATPDAVP